MLAIDEVRQYCDSPRMSSGSYIYLLTDRKPFQHCEERFDANDSIVYIGPNASLRYKRFWLTTTILLQVTGISDEPDLQLRTIFGVEL